MKFVIIHEIKELRGKLYFVVKGLELCKQEKAGMIKVLSGELVDQVIEPVSENVSDDSKYAGIIFDYKKACQMFNEANTDKIIETFSTYFVGKIFNYHDGEFVESPEMEYVKDSIIDVIIGQDEQIKEILSAIYNNQHISNFGFTEEEIRVLKKHLIVSGGTGTGKTTIMNLIAKLLNLPIIFYDMANFFNDESKGKVTDIIRFLVEKADCDLEKAQKGIIVVDNFEQLNNSYAYSSPKIVANIFQERFASLMGRTEAVVQLNDEEGVKFDTTNLTLVFLGDSKKLRVPSSTISDIGFNREKITLEETMIESGFSKSIMDKITNIVFMKDYTVEDYKKILLESSISPLLLKGMQLQTLAVEFDCDDEFITFVAEEAYKLHIGAYGLIKVISNVFQDFDFELLSQDIESIKIENGKFIKTRKRDSEK